MNSWKTLSKASLCGFYKYTGLLRGHETLARWAGQQFMAILLFHRVTDAIPEDGLTVSTARFRKICRMLQRGFCVVPLEEIFRIHQSGEPFPPRTVAITFDDCYRDNLFAARILADHSLPACFFVPTGFIGTDHIFDWDRHLPPMPNLSWDDLCEMVCLGFEIGSHTVTHPNMGMVTPEQARQELCDSRKAIEERLGQRVRWFAYPFGGVQHFRPEWLPLLAEAGYEGALSAHGGFVYPGTDGRLLPREAVPSFHSILNLEMHLSGCLNWLYALKRWLGRPEVQPDPYLPSNTTRLRSAAEPAFAGSMKAGQL
jgi:peptidoglycan/xylan/chitin deacetylase (PgdA/CDA1 family)